MFKLLREKWRARQEIRRIHYTKYEWSAHQTQGGGSFGTPPMYRREAMEYVSQQGAHQVIYVDDNHHFIFYK